MILSHNQDKAKIYPKGDNTSLSTNFKAKEFDCPCGDCKATLIHPDLVCKLQALRTSIDTKLSITSGYRCPGYQQQLRLRGYETAKGISQHTLGKAVDITNQIATGAELEQYAREVGFKAVGIGRTWVHLDLRDDMDRRWFYAK